MVTERSNAPAAARSGGFTLIELMVVVAVIGLLVGVAMPTYRNAITRARESVLQENLFILRQTIDRYYADKGYYPQALDVLVDEGYLRQIPVDPFLGRNEWEEVLADPDTSLDASQPPGVWDVRSLADGSTRDGRPFSDL